MTLFVKTIFWIELISIVILCLNISIQNYPRKREMTLGADIVSLFFASAMFAWSCFLLFGA